ncbi:MAG: hypothetical protein ACHP9T_13095 [Caulobacterales bacterium]|jgi:hypothetical protein
MPNYRFNLIDVAGRTVRRIDVECKDDDQAVLETLRYTDNIASIDIRRRPPSRASAGGPARR